jgi:hypothetical protein
MTLTPDPKFSLQRELERAFFKKKTTLKTKKVHQKQQKLYKNVYFCHKTLFTSIFFCQKKLKVFLTFFKLKPT